MGAGHQEGRPEGRLIEWITHACPPTTRRPGPNRAVPRQPSRSPARSCSPTPAVSTRPSSSSGCRTRTAARSSRSPPTSARARRSSPRARRRSQLGISEEEHLHRGPARGVRPRLRVPDVPRERGLRRRIPARHVDRAAADREAPGRDRAEDRAPTRSRTARPARATTRCASSSARTRWRPNIRIIAPWREWDLLSREKLLAYADQHGIPVDFKKREGRRALFDGRQPAAHQLRRRHPRGPGLQHRRSRCGA